jgi:putative NIF3 family GTP cyclohydrolase 1 type 2
MERDKTGDGLVFGDGERPVRTVAVTIIASPAVIRRARELGADMILTHEPTFATALAGEGDPIVAAKRALCEEVGIPIVRLHDHMHFTEVDKINLGVLDRLGLPGDFDGQKTFTLREPMTAAALIRHICGRLALRHPRYIGDPDRPVRTLSLLFGAWGDARILAELSRPEVDLAIIGEGCEYSICEYVRDAVELGAPKGLLILGHMGSEKAGMEYLADKMNELMPDLRAVYIDAGEVYG